MTYITTPQTTPQPATRKRFSTPALLFGSIIAGLGLAGIVATISDAGWEAGLAVGMILGGMTTVVGLLYRYRSTTASPSVPPAVPTPGVPTPGVSVSVTESPDVEAPDVESPDVESPDER